MIHFAEVMNSADSFNSVSDVERSLITILLFTTLWASGFIYIGFDSRKSHLSSGVNSREAMRIKKEMKKDGIEKKEDPKIILTQYLDELIPTVFQTKSVLARLTSEVIKHHRYLTLFLGERLTTGRERRLICLQMLTVQSMLMFMLAVLYELQV